MVHRRPGQGITSWGTLLPQNLPQKPKIGRIGQRAGHARWPAGSRLPTGHTGVVRAQAEARALADLSSALATSRIGMWGYTAVPEDRCICFYCTLTLPSLWISVSMCLSVSLFICLSSRISRILCVQTSPDFSARLTYGHGSVLWWQCSTLCTSGFVNDVMFSRNRPNEPESETHHNNLKQNWAFLPTGESISLKYVIKCKILPFLRTV